MTTVNFPTNEDYLEETNPTATRIELLENIERALSDRETYSQRIENQNSSSKKEPERLETFYPTLKEHSQHWSLNGKQHKAFLLMAAALLQNIFSVNNATTAQQSSSAIDCISRISTQLEQILPLSKQLLMFLGGCGGSGKSRVIESFIDFSRRWYAASLVTVTATSGIAAMLIGGSTLHSALGIGTQSKPPKPSQKLIKTWSHIGILIIDEISMMRAALLDLLDTRLKQLKTRNNKIFGGIHIVFSGDFYQLPPVGTSVISSVDSLQKGNPELRALRGQELWNACLTDVIILEENKRQNDPEWASSLLRWRINQPTREDIALVNSRLINNEHEVEQIFPIPATPIAVCDNESREKALRFTEQEMLRKNPVELNCQDNCWRSHGFLVIQARIKKLEGHQEVNQKHEDYIRSLSSSRLKGTGNLFCIKDVPYIITKNQNVSKGIANGTIATIQVVILNEGAVVRTKNLSGQPIFAVYADEVRCLVLKHTLKKWEEDHSFPSLPEGCFPLMATTSRIIVPLGKTDQNFSVKTTLFLCEMAIILTGHKMQGQTLQSVILGNLSRIHKYGRTGWIYVVFSRVTSLSGLFLMTPLEENPEKYKSRKEITNEMERLQSIEKKTLLRLNKID